MQARTRNLSTGEFGPKCAQRYHAIYFSSSQKIIQFEYDSAPGRKYTAHFGSFSPASVKGVVLKPRKNDASSYSNQFRGKNFY